MISENGNKIEKIWAVCVTNEDENLIPNKLYKIIISSNLNKVKAKNEKGETEFYPKKWFAPLNVSQNLIDIKLNK